MTALSVDIQGKAFGTNHVLGQITLELADGEIAALLGPSGCGKSTLLSIIAGLDGDFRGSVTAAAQPVAMIFQTPRLLPWRTLEQNIALIPGAGGAPRARELLDRVGLSAAADQFPEKVSLGMQRRAALARALAIRPGLILMDEPLVSLDAETSADMRTLIAATLAEAGATALIATHDRREALHLADRVIELGGSPTTPISDRRSPIARADRQNPAMVETLHREWFQGTL